jgi:PAS domain S-box-containing protein
MDYDKLTRAELIRRLKSLETGTRGAPKPPSSVERSAAGESERLLHELQIHQAELEAQNHELREAQRLLESSRDRYADLYDFAPVGYASLDEKGVIREINLTGAAMLAVERSRMIGQPFIRYLDKGEVQSFLNSLKRCRQTGDSVTMEVSLAVKGGGSIPAQLLCVPVENAESRAVVYRLAITDISERKLLEGELAQLLTKERSARADAEAANRLKDEFLALVSHELRSPLNSINGWVRMLRGGKLGPEDLSKALVTIERNSQALNRLVEDLLDASRIIMGKLKMEIRMVDLRVIIEDALETARPAAEGKGVELAPPSELRSVAIAADPNRLQQAVWNLLSNAVKFTPAGGRVSIDLTVDGDKAEILVRDTGIGIAPDFLPYVFERFRQVETGPGRKYGGLGLGLAIVRHIVELHGGEVEAASAGHGQGATFTLKLPVSALDRVTETLPAVVPPTMEVPEAVAAQLVGLRILVVDDEDTHREILRITLDDYGAIVTEATSPAEAMNLLENGEFDLLISDIGMPGVDGYMFICQVREIEARRGGRIPAVALTAYAQREDRVRAMKAGFDSYVTKPVDAAELALIIVGLTERFDWYKRAKL